MSILTSINHSAFLSRVCYSFHQLTESNSCFQFKDALKMKTHLQNFFQNKTIIRQLIKHIVSTELLS